MSTDNPASYRPAPPGQDSDPTLCVSSHKALHCSAVPRRSSSKEMHEATANLEYDIHGDMIAPLGFEPEGRATKPSFCEGNLSLMDFISDRHGFALFKEYLRAHKQESLLDFLQSCDEFKRLALTGSTLATSKANATYNNHMHSKHLCAGILQDSIRAKIKHSLSSEQPLKETLFDNAKDVILSFLNEFHYGRFLGSDVYKHSDVLKAMQGKDRVTPRNFTRFLAPALPSLHEEKVYEQNSDAWSSYDVNPNSLGRTGEVEREGYVPQNLNLTKAALAGMFLQPPPPVVSVDHSDVQSLSSDALTDDTKSTVTDNMMAKSMEKMSGPGFQDVASFVPRTKKLPKARKQLPPEEFARILIEKLEKVLIEREQEERAAVNLACLPHEHVREKKSILEDAAERHLQYQQAGRFRIPPPPKFQEPCYPIPTNTIPPYMHPGYIEQQGITGYYPGMEAVDSSNTSWQGCPHAEHVLEKQQCAALVNTKKQWESVGTLESAPDSGVSVGEDSTLPPEARNRILEWMEHSEKEVQQHSQQGNYHPKNTRTKRACAYNAGLPGAIRQGTMHLQPIAQDPLMPPLAQPDSRNTIEEVAQRLSQRHLREKKSKQHKNRAGYLSSKASQATCPKFPGEGAPCSSSVAPGGYQPAGMYSSSSVISSVPSTVNSNDSGLGGAHKNKPVEGTSIVYHLDGEKYPYRSVLPDKVVVLRQFKELVAFKKGNYRYFFKTETEEEDCRTVYEEIKDDDAVLPCYKNKIICQVKQSKHE